MQLVQVDVVELQPLQAGVDLVHQVVARLPAGVDRRFVHDACGLGGYDDLVARQAETLDGLTGERFRLAQRIHIGGIDKVHPGLERLFHQGGGGVLPQAAHHLPETLAAEGHGAQAQLGNIQAGAAQQTIAHGVFPVLWQ